MNENVKENESLDCFAYVELFGHTQIAGRVVSKPFGSTVFFQIDVTRPDGTIEFSRVVNASAVFSITPVSEEWCKAWSQRRPSYSQPVPYLPAPVAQSESTVPWADSDADDGPDDSREE